MLTDAKSAQHIDELHLLTLSVSHYRVRSTIIIIGGVHASLPGSLFSISGLIVLHIISKLLFVMFDTQYSNSSLSS